MLVAFRSFHSSVFLRAISIACVMVALLYLGELNLDGSTPIVPEVETNIVRPYFTRLTQPWTEILCSLLREQVDCVRARLTENFIASAHNSLQRHNYRVALPRSSVPDHL
jgi:hypothetical protein